CRAGDEDEAAREMGEVRNLGRYPKLLDRPDLHRDESDRSTDRVLLEVDVDTEARAVRQRICEVQLERLFEGLALALSQDAVEKLSKFGGLHHRVVLEALERATKAHRGR